MALRTATSRRRSSADRYTIVPMIMAATNHSRIRIMFTDETDFSSGRIASSATSSFESTVKPSGTSVGISSTTIAVARSCPR